MYHNVIHIHSDEIARNQYHILHGVVRVYCVHRRLQRWMAYRYIIKKPIIIILLDIEQFYQAFQTCHKPPLRDVRTSQIMVIQRSLLVFPCQISHGYVHCIRHNHHHHHLLIIPIIGLYCCRIPNWRSGGWPR